MRDQWFILISLLILSILTLPILTHAKAGEVKMPKEEGPVDIEADHLVYETEGKRYQADGHVVVVRGDLSLKADHVQLKMATKELTARGNVVLREGEDVLECERLEVNLNTRLGKVYQARLFLKDQNFHITGPEAEKLGEKRYRVRNGSFTTCDAKRPPWKFTVKELEVTQGGYGIAKSPIFYIEDIPLLYLPWATYPVKKERQTGLLLPRPGYSNKYGPELKTAFFWAMAKNMDSTLYADWLGDRGVKEGLEYRYAFTQDTGGRANFYFIDDPVFDKNRYAFFFRHQQKFPSDFYLKGNINYVSDRHYTQDFSEDLPEAATRIESWSRGQLRSNLFGGKNWDQFSFLTDGVVFNDLTKEHNDETVQKIPQISFYAHPQSLFKTPFFYDLNSSYTHFWRAKGVNTNRWDLFPQVSYPMRLLNVLKVEPDIGLRETFYRPYDDPTNQLQGWKSRETLSASIEMSTEFYRVYGTTSVAKISNLFNVAKWMHTIEPMIGYRYTPRVFQGDLPLFDEVDRIPYTNQFTYGITQRLIGKPLKEGVESGPSEYAKFIVLQNYSLGDPFERDSTGKGRYFSNIQAELWWYFTPYVYARWDGEFNTYRGDFDILNALVNVQDRRSDSIQAEYRYTKDNIHEINLYTRVKTITPLYLYGAIRYNLLEKMRVENIYGAEYQGQCWTLGLTVEDRNRSPDGTQEKELRFQVYFSLLGIGSYGLKSAEWISPPVAGRQ
jgi:LPS-assembly protein